MTFIHIKKIQHLDGENGLREQFAVPSMAISTPQGKKLIPNPAGTEASLFDSLGEAEAAIRQAGFDYVFEGRKTYTLKSTQRTSVQADSASITAGGQVLDDAIPVLISRLHDREPSVVSNAVYALGALRAHAALDALSEILGHDDPTVRKHVAEAMARMGRLALPHLLDAYREAQGSAAKNAPYIRLTVVQAFLELTHIPGASTALLAPCLPHAISALNDDNWLVRGQAALVIGRIAEVHDSEQNRPSPAGKRNTPLS